MKYLRFLLLIVLVVLLTIAVGAQDLPEFPVELPDEVAGGEPVSISVAACIGEDQDEVRENFDAQLARFMEAYPNVAVERTQFCFNPEAFAALVAGGNLPTLFGVPATEPQRLISQGVAADLTPYSEQLGLESVFNPTLIALLSDGAGRVYGMPEFSYAQGIGWDIEALSAAGYDSPPATWAELGEVAQAIARPDEGVAGFAMFLSGGAGGWHWTNLAYGFGATEPIRDNGDGTYTATYGAGPAVEAMQFLHDLRWPDEENALPLDLASNPTFETIDGRAIIFMSPADGSIGWLRVNMADVDLAQYGYTAVPQAPDGSRYTLTGGSHQMVFAGASEAEQEAAVVFHLWRTMSPGEFAASREIFHGTQAGGGTPVLPIFAGELQDAVDAFDEQFIDMPVENYAGFYEALDAGEIVLVPEPPFAQDFYVAISEVMTIVLTDPNADVAQLMADSASAFQSGILDPAASAQ
jgi:multiple sugar transport system substrate-binding protein